MPSTPSAPRSGQPRTYRTLPARILGWGILATAGVMALLTLTDVLTGRTDAAGALPPVALVAGLVAISWVLFLRPKVEIHDDRVELVNVVTDTTVPLTAIEKVTHQWSLELHDRAGRRHSAWAVPVRREVVRPKNIDRFADATNPRGGERMTAQGAADEVWRAMTRYGLVEPGADGPRELTAAAADGHVVAGADVSGQVTRRPAWSAVVLLVLAVLLAVGALLV